MAVPCGFKESNGVLDKPDELSADQCEALEVWIGQNEKQTIIISCWKLTVEDLLEINKTGRIWLKVMGEGMPPVALFGSHPFVES